MALLFLAGIVAGIVLTVFVLAAWITAAARRINERQAARANHAPLGRDAAFDSHHSARAGARAA